MRELTASGLGLEMVKPVGVTDENVQGCRLSSAALRVGAKLYAFTLALRAVGGVMEMMRASHNRWTSGSASETGAPAATKARLMVRSMETPSSQVSRTQALVSSTEVVSLELS